MLSVYLVFHIVFWLFLLMRYLRSGQATLWHPLNVYHFFHGLVFVVRPILVHWFQFGFVLWYMQYRLTEWDFIVSLVVEDVGLLTFQWVCLRTVGSAKPFPQHELRIPRGVARSFLATFILLFPVALLALYANRNGVGGIRDAATGVYVMKNSNGYLLEAPGMAVTLIAAFTVMNRFRLYAFIPLAIFFGMNLVYGVARWPLVFTVGAVFFAYAYFRGEKRAFLMLILSMAVVFPLFYIKGQNRDFFKNMSKGITTQGVSPGITRLAEQNQTFRSRFDGMDFAQYESSTLFITLVPERTGSYTYFTEWLQLFTEPIPRRLWPGKPVGAPVNLFEKPIQSMANVMGFSPTMIGSGWMALGMVGVIFQAALTANLIGRAYRYFCAHGTRIAVAIAYFLLNTAMIQYYRDGSISIFRFGLFLSLPFIVWFVLMRLTQASPPVASRPIRRTGPVTI